MHFDFLNRFSHPYEFELDKFEPDPELLKVTEPVAPKPLSETPLVQVTTEEELNNLLNELYNYSEIAIDLEHHSYRSFMGITCLMQISTKDKDYLVDTLALRDKLAVLNEVFTKPSIVKVTMELKWVFREYFTVCFRCSTVQIRIFSGCSETFHFTLLTCSILIRLQSNWNIQVFPSRIY